MAGLLSLRMLAMPSTIVMTRWEFLLSGQLLWHLLVLLTRVLAGLGIGLMIRVLLALASGLSWLREDVVDTPVQILLTLPFLARVPLSILWFGIGKTLKVAFVVLGTTFPITSTCSPASAEWSRTWPR